MTTAASNPFLSTVHPKRDTTPVVLIGPEDGTAVRYRTGKFVVSSTATVLTAPDHELAEGDVVQLGTTEELPNPLATGQAYYVRNPTAGSFSLSETAAGSLISTTNGGSGTHSWTRAGDVAGFLRPRSIQRSSGGGRPDFADFTFDLISAGRRIERFGTPTSFARQVEVRMLDVDGDPTTPLAWGDLTAQQLQLGRSTREETVGVRAELRSHHFGSPLLGMTMYDPVSGSDVVVERDPVFNPEVGGFVRPNMSSKDDHDGFPSRYWLDPQASRTVSATDFQTATAESWRLREAIITLCRLCNPNEEFVKNPEIPAAPTGFERRERGLDDFFAPEPGVAAPVLVNVRLTRGRTLDAYLDQLLPPRGFDWFVDLEIDDHGAMQRRIVIYRRGAGLEKQFHWLPVGGQFTGMLTQDLRSLELETNVAELATKVTASAAPEVREVTLELYRGWDEDDDGTAIAEIADTDPTWKVWPANLAGDYYEAKDRSRLRSVVKPIPTLPPNLSAVFSKYVARERRWLRPLSLEPTEDADVSRRRDDVLLEYWDGSSWLVYVPGENGNPGYRARTDEATIEFSAVPEVLHELGATARLRCTGCLVGDAMLSAVSSHDGDLSPTLREVEMYVDLADRFADRQRQSGGATWSGHDANGDHGALAADYGSVLHADDAEEQDDATDLQEYVDRLGTSNRAAAVDGEFRLIGLVHGYGIGDLITSVDGRDLDLNAHAAAASSERYLQVTGMVWDVEARTTLPITEPAEAAQ